MSDLKLFTIGFVAFVLTLAMVQAAKPVEPSARYAPPFPYEWRVEPYPMTYSYHDGTKEVRTEYKLYCGNDQTRMIESQAFKMMPRVWIMHVPENVRVREDFTEGYSVTVYFPGTGYSPRVPLHNVWEPEFSGSILGGLTTIPGCWGRLPDPIKYLIVEFPEAVIIHYQPQLRTVSVLFHPDNCEDYTYHRERLFRISPTT